MNENVDRYSKLDKQNYKEELKRTFYDLIQQRMQNLKSNYKIYDISTTGALIKNENNLKVGDNTNVRIVFEDMDVTLKSKVISIEGEKAGIEFIDVPFDVANRILYRYMQQKSVMKLSIK